mmetsp:Transcript_20676/g.47339  ORF Transcript_20676/g.47339 Transcript_20676/m.47339 type:complete len:99 (+) Transcript_20676:292-588(+)
MHMELRLKSFRTFFTTTPRLRIIVKIQPIARELGGHVRGLDRRRDVKAGRGCSRGLGTGAAEPFGQETLCSVKLGQIQSIPIWHLSLFGDDLAIYMEP